MKIKLISQDELESKLQSLSSDRERVRFLYGLRGDTLFGNTYDVLGVTQEYLPWSEAAIIEYTIQKRDGCRRYIPSWLIEEIYEEEIEL